MAVQRMAGLRNALQPMHLQDRTFNSPYFQGRETERSWLNLMRDIESDMKGNSLKDNKAMLMRDLDLPEQEAFDMARDYQNGRGNRQVNIAIPHAFASEMGYAEALKAMNPNSKGFNNVGDGKATDLDVMLGDLQKFVDVQNHSSPDYMTMQLLGGLDPNDVSQAIRNSSSNDSLLNIVSKLYNSKGNRQGKPYRTKLMQSRNAANAGHFPKSKIKDMLIGGELDVSQIQNLGGVPSRKGSYNWTTPKSIDLLDLDTIRPELLGLQKSGLRKQEIIFDLGAAKRGNLDLQVPMEYLRRHGGVTDEYIDEEVQRILLGM